LSIAELSTLTGIPERTLREWRTKGILPSSADQGVLLRAIITHYKQQVDEARNQRFKEGDDAYYVQKVRLTQAQADKIELENLEREGELVEADAVTLSWSAYISACKARLLGIPTRLALELSGITEPHDIQNILQESIDEALLELSNAEFVQRVGAADPSSSDLQTAATADH
jgi:phage terminase Nu1 subunit (DNA packaging protein)